MAKVDYRELLMKRLRAADKLAEAVRKFTKLPNWENRVGDWKDVNDAAREFPAAVAEYDATK